MLYCFHGNRLKNGTRSFYYMVRSNWKSIFYDSYITTRTLYVNLIFERYKL
jgi:hypothetical protein